MTYERVCFVTGRLERDDKLNNNGVMLEYSLALSHKGRLTEDYVHTVARQSINHHLWLCVCVCQRNENEKGKDPMMRRF